MKKNQETLQKEYTILEAVLYMAFELSQNKWKLEFKG